jgi:hypothetical protein
MNQGERHSRGFFIKTSMPCSNPGGRQQLQQATKLLASPSARAWLVKSKFETTKKKLEIINNYKKKFYLTWNQRDDLIKMKK